MIKAIKILLLSCMMTLPIYAQTSEIGPKVMKQAWNENHFTSNQTLVENIKDMSELKQMHAVLIKGYIEELSMSQESLSVFIPLDLAFANMKRKEKNNFLKKTSSEELKLGWKEYIVPGRLDYHSIKRNLENKKIGSIFVRTLGSNQLEFILKDGDILIRDVYGNEAKWVKGDFYYANGLFHFIDNLLFIER